MQIRRYPVHLGVIPDGNRRWSKKNSLPVREGYAKAIEVLRNVSMWSLTETPIRYLTVYGLSSENIRRGNQELDVLFELYEEELLKLLSDKTIHDNKICVRVIGQRELLPLNVQRAIGKVENATKDYGERYLNVALGYGGREEILKAMREMASEIIAGGLDLSHITEEEMKRHLYTNGSPYPDLIIRTAEKRLSNFLTWQSAYSELYFVDKYFPDVTVEDLKKALVDFDRRERRFGR